MRNFKLAAAAFAALMAASGMAHAGATCGDSAAGFDGFIKQFRKEAAAAGVNAKGLSALDGVQYQPGIIKKDRAQGVFSLSFIDFTKRMVSNYRITEGADEIQMRRVAQVLFGVAGRTKSGKADA